MLVTALTDVGVQIDDANRSACYGSAVRLGMSDIMDGYWGADVAGRLFFPFSA